MGRVLLGVSPDGRLVAVKQVHADLADDEFRARFRREVAASRRASGASTTQPLYNLVHTEPGLTALPAELRRSSSPVSPSTRRPAHPGAVGSRSSSPRHALRPAVAFRRAPHDRGPADEHRPADSMPPVGPRGCPGRRSAAWPGRGERWRLLRRHSDSAPSPSRPGGGNAHGGDGQRRRHGPGRGGRGPVRRPQGRPRAHGAVGGGARGAGHEGRVHGRGRRRGPGRVHRHGTRELARRPDRHGAHRPAPRLRAGRRHLPRRLRPVRGARRRPGGWRRPAGTPAGGADHREPRRDGGGGRVLLRPLVGTGHRARRLRAAQGRRGGVPHRQTAPARTPRRPAGDCRITRRRRLPAVAGGCAGWRPWSSGRPWA